MGRRAPLQEMEGVGGDEDGSDALLEALPRLHHLYPNPATATVPGEEGNHGDVALDVQLPGDDRLVHFLEAAVGTAVQEQQSDRGRGAADLVAVVVTTTESKGEEGEGCRLTVIVEHVVVGDRFQHHLFLVLRQSHTNPAAVVFNYLNQNQSINKMTNQSMNVWGLVFTQTKKTRSSKGD